MSVTKKQLIDIIRQINDKVDIIPVKLSQQQQQIESLELENAELRQRNKNIYDQVKKYVKELEQIKAHYVSNSNNKIGQ